MAKYKLTQKTNADGTTQDVQLDASCVDLSGYVPTSRTINSKALSSNITLAAADVKALPNYSLSISTNGGNPREVRFVRVNYSTFDGNNAAYFRIGAMCSHGNGSSYTFLEDIIIGVSATPSVTCTIYKQVQNISTYTIDGHSVYFGDVYWVVDTTNKYVDFYIIGGQYATINFTPFMRIGNTINDTSKIIQYTSANYYSSGTRVWDATGNGSLYARTSDISGKQDALVSGTNIKTINGSSILGSGDLVVSGTPQLSGYTFTLKASVTSTATKVSSLGLSSMKKYLLMPYGFVLSSYGMGFAYGGTSSINCRASFPLVAVAEYDDNYSLQLKIRSINANSIGDASTAMAITKIQYCRVYEITES